MNADDTAQNEEQEALLAIYDGDPNFKELSFGQYQYKVSDDSSDNAFLVEINWPEKYPDEPPLINMDTFFNNSMLQTTKDHIRKKLLEQAKENRGMAMTFTLFEWVKENSDVFFQLMIQVAIENCENISNSQNITTNDDIGSEMSNSLVNSDDIVHDRQKLSKQQKRRLLDRFGATAGTDKPRGWNWVDIVKHLSQTGSSNS